MIKYVGIIRSKKYQKVPKKAKNRVIFCPKSFKISLLTLRFYVPNFTVLLVTLRKYVNADISVLPIDQSS